MKRAFLILNFGTYEETTDCVMSIVEHIDTDDYKIVIVDNETPSTGAAPPPWVGAGRLR